MLTHKCNCGEGVLEGSGGWWGNLLFFPNLRGYYFRIVRASMKLNIMKLGGLILTYKCNRREVELEGKRLGLFFFPIVSN